MKERVAFFDFGAQYVGVFDAGCSHVDIRSPRRIIGIPYWETEGKLPMRVCCSVVRVFLAIRTFDFRVVFPRHRKLVHLRIPQGKPHVITRGRRAEIGNETGGLCVSVRVDVSFAKIRPKITNHDNSSYLSSHNTDGDRHYAFTDAKEAVDAFLMQQTSADCRKQNRAPRGTIFTSKGMGNEIAFAILSRQVFCPCPPTSKVMTKPRLTAKHTRRHACACPCACASKIRVTCTGYDYLDVDVHNSFCLEYLWPMGVEKLPGNPSQPSYIE